MIIKLSTKKLEKNLGLKLRKNVTCLGVDTASTTGLALIKTNSQVTVIKTDVFKLPSIPRKIANQMEKAEKYEQAMSNALNLIKKYIEQTSFGKPTILILEQSYLSINPETFGYLRCLQGIFYSELYKYFEERKIYLPTVARKLVGFNSNLPRKSKSSQKKKEICKWVSNIIKTEITDDNEADALILAFAGLKI